MGCNGAPPRSQKAASRPMCAASLQALSAQLGALGPCIAVSPGQCWEQEEQTPPHHALRLQRWRGPGLTATSALFFCTSTCLQDESLMPGFNKTMNCLPNTQTYQHFEMFLHCCLSAPLRLALKHQNGSWHLLQSVSFPLHRFPEGWANHVYVQQETHTKIHELCQGIKVSV